MCNCSPGDLREELLMDIRLYGCLLLLWRHVDGARRIKAVDEVVVIRSVQ